MPIQVVIIGDTAEQVQAEGAAYFGGEAAPAGKVGRPSKAELAKRAAEEAASTKAGGVAAPDKAGGSLPTHEDARTALALVDEHPKLPKGEGRKHAKALLAKFKKSDGTPVTKCVELQEGDRPAFIAEAKAMAGKFDAAEDGEI